MTDEPTLPPPAAPASGGGSDRPSATGAQAPSRSWRIRLRPLALHDPLRWIARGGRDLIAAPAIGVFYGACFVGMGWALLTVYQHAPAYTLALSAGFLLMGPFLCLGLYQVSRRLEQGQRPGWADSLFAFRSRAGTMGIFGAVLLVLELLWGRASMVVFAVSFDGMPDFKGSLRALLDPENAGFILAWVGVGAAFAGLIFAISVVAIPLILHRQTDAITAGLTSLRLCLTQPLVMLSWGLLITVLVVAAMLPGFLGLLVIGPLLGHASWHAYRAAVSDEMEEVVPPDWDAIDAQREAERQARQGGR